MPLELIHLFLTLPLSAKRMSELLTRHGIEAEGSNESSQGPVVAQILSLTPHPNAQHLRLVEITYGASEPTTVVSGAPNLVLGAKVIYAKPGTQLPAGEVTVKKIRGIASPGMLLSGLELGIASEQDRLYPVADESAVGETFSTHSYLEIDTKSARYDILSAYGLAREIAATGACALKTPPQETYSALPVISSPAITAGAALRYDALSFHWSNPTRTPELERLLQIARITAVHPVVDIVNLALLAVGHPLHVFDHALVGKKLTVAKAANKQSFMALDGTLYMLASGDLAVTGDGKPIALAGIIGSQESAVSPSSQHFLLEAALFPSKIIAQTSTRLNLLTQSALRFRRGSDSHTLKLTLGYVAHLLKKEGADLVGRAATGKKLPRRAIAFEPNHINALLGTTLAPHSITAALKRVGAKVEGKRVYLPQWRNDLAHSADLAEEVGRVIGYHKIPPTALETPLSDIRPRQSEVWTTLERLRTLGVLYGFNEVMTSSFAPHGALRAENPPSEHPFLRESFLWGHRALLERMLRGRDEVNIFEVGTVYPQGQETLAIGFTCAQDHHARLRALLDVLIGARQPSVHPGPLPFDQQRSRLWKGAGGNIMIGYLAGGDALVANKRSNACALQIPVSAFPPGFGYPQKIIPVPAFPVSIFDISIFPGTVPYASIAEKLATLQSPIQRFYLIDTYLLDGRQSVTLRFELSYADHTPTHLQLRRERAGVYALLNSIPGIEIRNA